MGEDKRARGVAAWRKGIHRTLDLTEKKPDDAGALRDSGDNGSPQG
jgi:hypothetical protein